MEDGQLHNAEQAMHAELPSQARAQRVRERLNEMFAALFTSSSASLQASSRSSMVAAPTTGTAGGGTGGAANRASRQTGSAKESERNPYRQRLREIYRERDVVVAQTQELLQQLDDAKSHISEAIEQQEQERTEAFTDNATVAPIVIDLKSILRDRDVDTASLPLLSAFDYLPRPKNNPAPQRANRPPSYARATKTSTMRLRAQARKFPDQVHELTESEAAEKWRKEVVEPPSSKRQWKGKMSKETEKSLKKELSMFKTKTEGFLRNPRDTAQQPAQDTELTAMAMTGTRQRQAAAEDARVFRPIPPVVAFNTFERNAKLQQTLTLVNTSRVSRVLRIRPLKSDHFAVTGTKFPTGNAQDAVAPGLSVEVTIAFTPDHLGTYKEELEILPENGAPFMVDLIGERNPPGLTLEPTVDLGVHLKGSRTHHSIDFTNTGGDTRFRIIPFSHVKSSTRASAKSSAAASDAGTDSIDLQNLEALPETFWSCNSKDSAREGGDDQHDARSMDTVASGRFFQITNACQMVAENAQSQLHVEATLSQEGRCRERFVIIFDNCLFRMLDIEAEAELPNVSVSGRHILQDDDTLRLLMQPCMWNFGAERTVTLTNNGAVPVTFSASIQPKRKLQQHPQRDESKEILPATATLFSCEEGEESRSSIPSSEACGMFSVHPPATTIEAGSDVTLTITCSPQTTLRHAHPVCAEAWLVVEAQDLPGDLADAHAVLLESCLQATISSCQASVHPPALAWAAAVEPSVPASIPIVIRNESDATLQFSCAAVVLPTAVLHLQHQQGSIPPRGTQHTSVIIAGRSEGDVNTTMKIEFDRAPPILLPLSVRPTVLGRYSATLHVHIGGRSAPELIAVSATVQEPLCCFTSSSILYVRDVGVTASGGGDNDVASLDTSFSHRANIALLPITSRAVIARTAQSARRHRHHADGSGDGGEADEVISHGVKQQQQQHQQHKKHQQGLHPLTSDDVIVSVTPESGVLKAGETLELAVAFTARRPGPLAPHMLVFDIDGVKQPLPLAVMADVRGVSLSYEVGAHMYTELNGPPDDVDVNTAPGALSIAHPSHATLASTSTTLRRTRDAAAIDAAAAASDSAAQPLDPHHLYLPVVRPAKSSAVAFSRRRRQARRVGTMSSVPSIVVTLPDGQDHAKHSSDTDTGTDTDTDTDDNNSQAGDGDGGGAQGGDGAESEQPPVSQSSSSTSVTSRSKKKKKKKRKKRGAAVPSRSPRQQPLEVRGLVFEQVQAHVPTYKLLRLTNHSGIAATLHASVTFFPARENVRLQVHGIGGDAATTVCGDADAANGRTAPRARTQRHTAAQQATQRTHATATAARATGKSSMRTGQKTRQLPRAPDMARKTAVGTFKRSVKSIKASIKAAVQPVEPAVALKSTATTFGACFMPEEAVVSVPPHGSCTLRVWCYADVWGDYSDHLVLRGEHLDTVHVPLRASVTGCSLVPLVTGASDLSPLLRLPSLALRSNTEHHGSGVDAVDGVGAGDGGSAVDAGDASHDEVEGRATIRKLSVKNPTSQPLALVWETYDVLADDKQLVDVFARTINDDPVLNPPHTHDNGSGGDGGVDGDEPLLKLRVRAHEGKRSHVFSVWPPVAVITPDQTTVFKVRFAPNTLGTFNGFVRAVVFTPAQASLSLAPMPASKDVIAFLHGHEERLPPFPVQTLMLDRETATLRAPTASEAKQLVKEVDVVDDVAGGDRDRGDGDRDDDVQQPQQLLQSQESQQQEQEQEQERATAKVTRKQRQLRFIAGLVRRSTLRTESTALTIQVTARAEHPLLQVVGAPDTGVLFQLSSDDVQEGRKAHSTSFTLYNPTSSRITFRLHATPEFQVGLVGAPSTTGSSTRATTAVTTTTGTAATAAMVRAGTGSTQQRSGRIRGRSPKYAVSMRGTSAVGGDGDGAVTAQRQATAQLGRADIKSMVKPIVLEPAQSCSVGVRWSVPSVRALVSRAWNAASPRKSLRERPSTVLSQQFLGDAESDRKGRQSREQQQQQQQQQQEEEEGEEEVVQYRPTAVTIADGVEFEIEGSPDVLRVPIKALLHLPHLQLQEDKLDFGRCVLGEPQVKTVTLINLASIVSRPGDVFLCHVNVSPQPTSAQLSVTPQLPLVIPVVGDGWQDQAENDPLTI
ncbi:hypothetical protein PTSG_08654 [Salpingoeca rosetta]|uniref:Deleted in lung and esophageal cancer protein 1 Ig-like domain-containing protein n=1 Tax=Salpingoeca rosetta (strain ATCC 50818 / BSB-021) TaxID=946362 RepID=F2UKA7_SALR5|nr:uncharacterized protein PTSG_08654 [Salpingoeca rosetta]EGD77556.1 hypothetical protein PTSG_08654 [Salpingoeca rosetta]|eukprot:XP_004990444.1 hypothetical protein PTSG_08654 [Salpingoeca rosetta]